MQYSWPRLQKSQNDVWSGPLFRRVRVVCSVASFVILSLGGQHPILSQNIMGVGPPNFESSKTGKQKRIPVELGIFLFPGIFSREQIDRLGREQSGPKWDICHFLDATDSPQHPLAQVVVEHLWLLHSGSANNAYRGFRTHDHLDFGRPSVPLRH